MTEQGKIAKGVAGSYEVIADDGKRYECKARGRFRLDGVKPLVGDNVLFQTSETEALTGNITEILTRSNELIRPAVANVDQVFLMFALAKPAPNFDLLTRFLILTEQKGLPVRLCFNKADIAEEQSEATIRRIYANSGYPVSFFSVARMKEQEASCKEYAELLCYMEGKTTVLAGTSGVGKSSLINTFCQDANMETGELSKKIDRGKNTTRHTELFYVKEHTFLMDTPGFSSIYFEGMAAGELGGFFREMREHEAHCRFRGCSHREEPGCGVKQAVKDGLISKERYESYLSLYLELSQKKRYDKGRIG